ncbi:unnamed protein product [Microthlaspi erraticum]|uniref:Exostosin GT47 domain-containing protein n=1 Tax=Microthlaspi erraticum TaxID=1685480 RepID=A0A6D2JCV3_9BRAS|nr:unnamed protein product [Microthlaspi erraticum]
MGFLCPLDDKVPYWNRTQGADHFFVVPRRKGNRKRNTKLALTGLFYDVGNDPEDWLLCEVDALQKIHDESLAELKFIHASKDEEMRYTISGFVTDQENVRRSLRERSWDELFFQEGMLSEVELNMITKTIW